MKILQYASSIGKVVKVVSGTGGPSLPRFPSNIRATWSTQSPDIELHPPHQEPISLTPSQLDCFKRDGYLVVKGALPAEYLRSLRHVALDYAERYEGAQKPFDKYSGRNAIHLPSSHARWAWDFVSSVGGLGIGRASAQLLAVADADDVSAAVATAISYTNLWLFDCHFFHCSDYPSYILSVFLYDLQ